MLASYQMKHPEAKCEKVFLSGGTAHFTGIVEYYSGLLSLPVAIGDPWRNIQYDPSLKPKIEEFGTSFSVAIGLALAGTDTLLKAKKDIGIPEKKKFSLKEFLTKKF